MKQTLQPPEPSAIEIAKAPYSASSRGQAQIHSSRTPAPTGIVSTSRSERRRPHAGCMTIGPAPIFCEDLIEVATATIAIAADTMT